MDRAAWWSGGLVLVVMALCGPWPGWQPWWWLPLVAVAGGAAIARPRGRWWWLWLPPALAAVMASWPAAGPPTRDQLSMQLGRHSGRLLEIATGLAEDSRLRRVFSSTGEVLGRGVPEPFEILDEALRRSQARSIYLADDRGELVAWAGPPASVPQVLRLLGDRQWAVEWWVGRARLVIREPILVDGRLVGAVTVVESSELAARSVWGMRAPPGWQLRLGPGDDALQVEATGIAPFSLPVRLEKLAHGPSAVRWLPWLLAAAVGMWLAPAVAAALLIVASGLLVFHGELDSAVAAVGVLLVAAVIWRLSTVLPRRAARAVIVAAVAAAAAAGAFSTLPVFSIHLPARLLAPGWGALWMVALAWVVAGWPVVAGEPQRRLGRRLLAGVVVAMVGLVADLVSVPVALERSFNRVSSGLLRPEVVQLSELTPVPVEQCRLDDLAPEVLTRWSDDGERLPVALVATGPDGRELSRWGQLTAAGGSVLSLGHWPITGFEGGDGAIEVIAATEPWSWLCDWGGPVEDAGVPLWGAVFTRSGEVSATLHPEVRQLDTVAAAELFYAGEGWVRVQVGWQSQLAKVWRRGDWLVAVIAMHPGTSGWVVQVVIATVWAMLGLLVVTPPRPRPDRMRTFGGRLRLLVAGGVVLPLVILTLFLHRRVQLDELRFERVVGLDALRAARWSVLNLGEIPPVDSVLAEWLAEQIGGEVLLFDGARLMAASRPDLVAVGRLPALPEPAAWTRWAIGRDDPVVLHGGGRSIAAAGVQLGDDRILLELLPKAPIRSGDLTGVVDWLLAGAILSALIALVLTARVEERWSRSLQDLVALARRIQQGHPPPAMEEPRELDLAEVVRAVRLMTDEVRRREESLRSQQELLRITLETLAPAVLVLSADGEVRFANPSGERMLVDHRATVLQAVQQLAVRITDAGGREHDTVSPYSGQDLTWQVGVARTPFPDSTDGLVAVVDDVSSLVRVDRLRQLNQMARIVAHEVKNPLTPVRLWVQELEEARRRGDADLGELVDEACREVGEQVDRLQATARSFSNLIALERWDAVPIDCVELVEDATEGLQILARRGIDLHLELPERGTCWLAGDRQWLRRALGNLIENSVAAIGESSGSIWIRGASRAGGVRIEVEDSGGGVPERRLEELFQPHFSTTSGGSGLGLALVGMVASRGGGSASAHNGDAGLVVRLDLPGASSPDGH